MSTIELVRSRIRESMEVKRQVLEDPSLAERILQAGNRLISIYQQDGKLLFCGNGGSAADAQHLSAELSGRFLKNRPPLAAEALHVNTSYLTAVANDFSYEEIYARAVEGLGRPGDALLAFSTSGNSPNILKAIEAARRRDMFVLGFSGREGGKMKALCDICLCVPSTDTARIQECHILMGHILCELIETGLFPHA